MNVSILLLIVGVVCLGAASAAPQLRQRNEKQVQTVEDEFPYKGATIEEVVVESALYIKPKATQQTRRVRSANSEDSPLQGIYATHKRVKRGRGGRGPGFGDQYAGNPGFGAGFGGSPSGGFGGNNQGFGGSNTQAGTSAGVGGTKAGVDVGAGPDGGNANANVQLNPLGPLGPSGFNQEQAVSNGAAHSNYNNGLNAGSSAANAQAQGFQSQTANGSFGASSASTATQSQNINPFGSNNAAGASLSQVYKLPNGQTINFSSTNSFANNGANQGNSHGAAVSVSR
ncbi:ATP-dependent RNA helicase glh-2 [Drosophila subobscura]|uniref:ATP-dependent RNA helicase glh-2 n=1 Tax=Drosophila subobscura TaxID=7241 RepID=UPI00155B1896|nr:ATP-dependent RNA helicase glh-2 [Drosophila subobscura]